MSESTLASAAELEWTVHPLKTRPQHAALAACVISLTAWAVMVTLHSLFLACLAIVVLVIATAGFWLPTTFRIDSQGASVKRWFSRRFRAWGDLRRVVVGKRAGLLSPFSSPSKSSWLEMQRGVVLWFEPQMRSEIERVIAIYFGSAGSGPRHSQCADQGRSA